MLLAVVWIYLQLTLLSIMMFQGYFSVANLFYYSLTFEAFDEMDFGYSNVGFQEIISIVLVVLQEQVEGDLLWALLPR